MDQMFFGVENAKNHEEFRRKVKVFHRIVLLTLFVFCISTILFTQFYLLPRYKETVAIIQLKQSVSKSPNITSNDDSTANWKTYTNTQYNFMFQYPNTYIQKDTTRNYSKGTKLISFSDNKSENLIIYVVDKSIDQYRYENNVAGVSYRFDINKKQWISTFTGPDPSGEIQRLAPQKINDISGVYFVKHDEGSCGGGKAIILPLTHAYVIEIVTDCIHAYNENPNAKQLAENLNSITDQILSTFKFTQ